MKKKEIVKEEESSDIISRMVLDTPSDITPLDLNIDLGRTDLNDLVGKIQDKINELVRKVN